MTESLSNMEMIDYSKFARSHGVTPMFVRLSVLGKRNSPLAKSLRLEYGRILKETGEKLIESVTENNNCFVKPQ